MKNLASTLTVFLFLQIGLVGSLRADCKSSPSDFIERVLQSAKKEGRMDVFKDYISWTHAFAAVSLAHRSTLKLQSVDDFRVYVESTWDPIKFGHFVRNLFLQSPNVTPATLARLESEGRQKMSKELSDIAKSLASTEFSIVETSPNAVVVNATKGSKNWTTRVPIRCVKDSWLLTDLGISSKDVMELVKSD